MKTQDGSPVDTVSGEETGVFTFTMPASDVTVSGTFRKIEEPAEADKSGLEQLVGELQKIDPAKYTEESVKVLTDALAEAEDLLKQDLAESDQQQITDMISKLEAARNQLVPVKEDPENPGSGGEDPDKPENPDKPADPGESGGQDKNDGSAVPSTGDSAPVMAVAFVLLFSGSVLVFVTKQRKMK